METIVENNLEMMQKVVEEATTCLKAKSGADWKLHSKQIASFMQVVNDNLAKAEALETKRSSEIKALEEEIAALKTVSTTPVFARLLDEAEKKLAKLQTSTHTKPTGYAGALAKNVDDYEAAVVNVVQKKTEERILGRTERELRKRREAAWPRVIENAGRAGIPQDRVQTVPCKSGSKCKYGFTCTFYHTEEEEIGFLARV